MPVKEFAHGLSMAPRGLRHKLWACFALGTLIPLLIMILVLVKFAFTFYPRLAVTSKIEAVNAVLKFFPMERVPSELLLWLSLAGALSLVGLWFTRSIIIRILKLAQEARQIVQQSNFTQQIRVMS